MYVPPFELNADPVPLCLKPFVRKSILCEEVPSAPESLGSKYFSVGLYVSLALSLMFHCAEPLVFLKMTKLV